MSKRKMKLGRGVEGDGDMNQHRWTAGGWGECGCKRYGGRRWRVVFKGVFARSIWAYLS